MHLLCILHSKGASISFSFYGSWRKPHGTDNPRFVGLLVFMDNAQPVFFTQCYDKFSQRLIRNAAPKLPVEGIGRCLLEWIAVNVLDGL
jgi:hypothetical protein